MLNMKPFFCFFGGKWRAAPRYPSPLHNEIVEPFAGSAGYSVRHYSRRVTLVEKDPTIAALWAYLIQVSAEEVRALPTRVDHVDSLAVLPEAKTLIGFWLNKGVTAPCKVPSKWMRDLHLYPGQRLNTFWGEGVRDRIASQVEYIRHWKVIFGDYRESPETQATWFIDPPYQLAGKAYKHGPKGIEFPELAQFCRCRKGQLIVCENVGANWLPFGFFAATKSLEGKHGKAKSKEAMYYQESQ